MKYLNDLEQIVNMNMVEHLINNTSKKYSILESKITLI